MKTFKQNNIEKHIGEKIAYLRRHRRMTLKDVGDVLELSPQQIQKYEKGIATISATTLWRISQLFGTDMNFFFNDYTTEKDTTFNENIEEFNRKISEQKTKAEIKKLLIELISSL